MSNEQEPPESGPAWVPQDPYAGDPPPGGLSPMGPGGRPPGEDEDAGPGETPQAGGYAGGYGSPPPGEYGGTTPSAYGAAGQPPGPRQDPYGPPPPQPPYAVPQQDPYGGMGALPPQPPYGPPQQNPYGAPQQSPYGAPQQDPYGAPQQPYGGAPQQAPYGTGPSQSVPGVLGTPGYGGTGGTPGGPGPGGPGPGGPGPSQGWAPSYPPPPPAQGRNKRPLIIAGIGAGVIVLLVAAVGLIGLTGGDGDDKAGPPTVAASNAGADSASRAAQGLGAVPALRYNGTFSSGGDDLQAQLSVTKNGSAVGTITVGGAKADLVSVDGNTYLKAPKEFWRDQGGVTTNPEDFAGRWAKAPDSAFNLDIKNVLAAGSIIRGLQGVGSYQTAGATEDVNGTPAIKVTGADAQYYISTANPPKLVRIVGTGTDTYQFDVAEVATTEVAALFQQLRGQVSALAGARDPSVRFLPAAKIKASNCGVSGCTMKLTVTTLSVGGGSSHIRAIMFGKITAGGRTGRTLGTCTDSATTSSGKKLNLSCTVRGSTWSSWVRGIRGSASYYVQARTVAEAGDVGDLLSIVDRERQGG